MSTPVSLKITDVHECDRQVGAQMTKLQSKVFSCRACVDKGESFRFEFAVNGYPKKFPPTIPDNGEAKVLFVALCPRPTRNYVLDWAMSGPDEFATLGSNLNQDGDSYLESYEKERFYRPFVEIAAEAYKGKRFDTVATVSDLYFCALPSRELREDSPCANLHLLGLIAEVRPRIIITKGNRPMHYLERFGDGRRFDYRNVYSINIDGFHTTLLPVKWWDLNSHAREPARTWLLENIRVLDSDAW